MYENIKSNIEPGINNSNNEELNQKNIEITKIKCYNIYKE